MKINSPETPPHTVDELEKSIKRAAPEKKTGAAFVNIDTRVLAWLIADARSLTEAYDEASQ